MNAIDPIRTGRDAIWSYGVRILITLMPMRGRFAISSLLGLRSEADIERTLREVTLPACEIRR